MGHTLYILVINLMSFRRIIREIGAASTVLLKNENNALPLNAPATIALIGTTSIRYSLTMGLTSC